ncbi:MAG: carbonic anhydrase [Bdellovibrionales bacterium RBG_16_40_8]|nr:MAG: carbonic anhydrase [Bdellovibrionales bacterium RBG_16_40_8]
MKKLINGIVEFRRKVQKGYKESFGGLASGQAPDTLFIACSDSRVVPNTFASTNPGDLFVVRNVGNLIPPCDRHGVSTGDESEAAAIEFSLLNLRVSDIIVCGHSECGAMRALINSREEVTSPNLKNWLRHGDSALTRLKSGFVLDESIPAHNQLSQLNVLLQIEHVKSYPTVAKRIEEKTLAIHGWWFDVANADVYAYEEIMNKFILIDEEGAEKIISRFEE